ncbi:uncharacterized protein LOC134237549 [Saccostrea cucullata]|uniref:uncharacterized protein LOC134237549 n=1 Tax=Saccostrea cuccullata TaxID=36930 RepID=UPI002ED42105
MDTLLVLVLDLLFFSCFVRAQLPELNQCPPEDPNCHPWCIEYVNKCRVCRCKKGFDNQGTGDKTSSWGGFNTDLGGGGFGGSDGDSLSSLEEKWGSIGGESWGSKGNDDKTNIIIIEKEKKPEVGMMSFPGSSFAGKSPFQMNGPSPVMMKFPPRRNSIPSGCTPKNVPLVSPGVPRYCVTGLIIDCPRDCVVTDEFGCKSCPCAPAVKAWMPVCENAPAAKPQKVNSCIGTKLCIMSCKGEAKIGETGADGCQKCTCIKRENNLVPKTTTTTTTTTPKPTTKNIMECTKLITCMIKCKDTGYDIGNTKSDGCPNCRCKDKTSNNNSNNNNNNNINNNGGGGMQTWTAGSGGMGMNGMNTGIGSGMTGSGNSILNNVGSGTGSGGGDKCQFPLCISGSSGGGGNPMMPSAGSSGGSSGGCAGPFCASMTGSGSGGGMGMGGGSGGMMMGGGGGGGSGGNGPFKASLSSAAAASGGMGSAMKSPFMAAASGGGGAGHNPMQGPMLSMCPGAGKPTDKEVEKVAYNSECFGPSCSAKNGKMHGLIGSCMDMERCIANCGGSYEIGPRGPDGCQSCTCNPE